MAKYDYFGPVQVVPLRTGSEEKEGTPPTSKFSDLQLAPGMTDLDMPEDNPIVMAWEDAGLIKPSAEAEAAPKPKPAPKPAPKPQPNKGGTDK